MAHEKHALWNYIFKSMVMIEDMNELRNKEEKKYKY